MVTFLPLKFPTTIHFIYLQLVASLLMTGFVPPAATPLPTARGFQSSLKGCYCASLMMATNANHIQSTQKV